MTISGPSASPISPHASDERPIFWILAGPNGSGKSSLYDENTEIQAFGRSVWIINPDLLARRIETIEGCASPAANLEAVIRIEAWLEASIRAHQTVGVETVLSTGKYRRLVDEARRLNFEFRLIYVVLDSPDRNVERVRLRVAKGGHDVPEDRIRARYARGRWPNCRGFSIRLIRHGYSTTPWPSRSSSGKNALVGSVSRRTPCRKSLRHVGDQGRVSTALHLRETMP